MRVLVLAREFPNAVFPTMGLWAESLTQHLLEHVEIEVVSPVPYCPPLPNRFRQYTQYRDIPGHGSRSGLSVHYPRYLLSPGYLFRSAVARAYYRGVLQTVRELHAQHPFDLIHAHFGFPDGVVASKLHRRLGIPVVVTDHAFWRSWMQGNPSIRRQTVEASADWAYHACVSAAHREDVLYFTQRPDCTGVIHLGFDAELFHPRSDASNRREVRLLFVGFINYTKGVDVLLEAVRMLRDRMPRMSLTMVGGGFDSTKIRQGAELRQKATDLGLEDCVHFAGIQSPEAVAEYMRNSDILVSASRRETFGAVIVEALGSGIPVVATRCGGPEDIVTDAVGTLVEPEDAAALADGIEATAARLPAMDRFEIAAYAREHFSWDRTVDRYLDVYSRVATGS